MTDPVNRPRQSASPSFNPTVSKPLNHHPTSHTDWLSSSQTASRLHWAAPCRPNPLQRRPCILFFTGRGSWLLSSGSRPVSNACLACKQAAGSSPSFSQCAAQPSWAARSCDTDPTPITPRQAALIDPSSTLTSIYILFVTSQVCCMDMLLCVFATGCASWSVCTRVCLAGWSIFFIACCWHGSP